MIDFRIIFIYYLLLKMNYYKNNSNNNTNNNHNNTLSRKKPIENVLVLQGGGSLGAFACGVFKALYKKKYKIRYCVWHINRCYQWCYYSWE